MDRRDGSNRYLPGEADIMERIILLVREAGGEVLRHVELDGESALEAIGFDSMRYLKLVLHLEKFCGVSLENVVDEFDLTKVKTISDVASLVARIKG